MNICIFKENNQLVLSYSPTENDEWINGHMENDEPILIKRSGGGSAAFCFRKKDLIRKEPEDPNGQQGNPDLLADIPHTWYFKLATLDGGEYYHIPSRIVSSKHDVFIHNKVDVSVEFFVASVLNTRIVPIVDKMIDQPLHIGGNVDGAIPEEEYRQIINQIPTREELHLYAQSRIESILSEYIPETKESGAKLSAYIENRFRRAKSELEAKQNRKRTDNENNSCLKALREIDRVRVGFALARLRELLDSVEKHTEKQWQSEIEAIILLLFPQYMAKVSQLKIPESFGEGHSRLIDLALVSMSRNIDIVEIKKPEDGQLLSRKPNYRGNYIPSRNLSAAIMQAEKYLDNLERWGENGEKAISSRIKVLGIKIRSPKAILILGRKDELNDKQKESDFEIIKRKYVHIADVITYDDLVERLENVLRRLKSEDD